jgi:hypothetical protein
MADEVYLDEREKDSGWIEVCEREASEIKKQGADVRVGRFKGKEI